MTKGAGITWGYPHQRKGYKPAETISCVCPQCATPFKRRGSTYVKRVQEGLLIFCTDACRVEHNRSKKQKQK